MSLFKSIFGSASEDENTSKINWKQLTTIEQLDDIVGESNDKPIIIFKHSTRCSISRMALKQFEKEFVLEEEITPYFLDLLNYRDISNEIATKFDVIHQSPQLILIKNGKSVYNVSHSDIDALELKNFI